MSRTDKRELGEGKESATKEPTGLLGLTQHLQSTVRVCPKRFVRPRPREDEKKKLGEGWGDEDGSLPLAYDLYGKHPLLRSPSVLLDAVLVPRAFEEEGEAVLPGLLTRVLDLRQEEVRLVALLRGRVLSEGEVDG